MQAKRSALHTINSFLDLPGIKALSCSSNIFEKEASEMNSDTQCKNALGTSYYTLRCSEKLQWQEDMPWACKFLLTKPFGAPQIGFWTDWIGGKSQHSRSIISRTKPDSQILSTKPCLVRKTTYSIGQKNVRSCFSTFFKWLVLTQFSTVLAKIWNSCVNRKSDSYSLKFARNLNFTKTHFLRRCCPELS